MFLFPIFLYIFVLCLLYNYIAEGGSFVLFSGGVDFVRSFREQTPRNAKVGKDSISIEYKYDQHRIYSIIFPKREPIPWVRCAAYVGKKWVPVTKEVAFCAGPYKNFYEIPITPEHINSGFEKLGFEVPNMDPIIVNKGEFIIAKMRAAFRAGGLKANAHL